MSFEFFGGPENKKVLTVLENAVEASTTERFKELSEHLFLCNRVNESILDWDSFYARWQQMSHDVQYCTELFNARKHWLEAMGYGEKFQHFFEEQIMKEAQDTPTGGHHLYEMISSYCEMGFVNPGAFLNKIMAVQNNPDGSTAHSILAALETQGNEDTLEVMVRYAERICSEGYAREYHKESDLTYVADVLRNLVGKEGTIRVMQDVFDKHPGLTDFFARNSYIFERGERSRMRPAFRGPVDFELERQRLPDLQAELDDMAAHPGRYQRLYQSRYRYAFDDDFYEDDLLFGSRSGGDHRDEPDEAFDTRDFGTLREGSVLDQVAIDRIEKVNNLVLKEDVAPTVAPTIQLHMFNFLSEKPDATEEDLIAEFQKINRLSEREEVYSNIKNPLPTIGIEIEIPRTSLSDDKISVLNRLGINNQPEAFDDLWEVNPGFSYNAGAQARLLQELSHLGVLPINHETKKVDPYQLLSLHVNFGLPALAENGTSEARYQRYKDEMYLLNDLLVYGYTSTGRLYGRKTNQSLRLSGGADRSKKDKGKPSEELPYGQMNDFVRMELRANEFKDYPTFRMLMESQRLVAMLTSYIKYEEGVEITFVESYLADLWISFQKEVRQYLSIETGSKNVNLVDTNQREVIDVLARTDLKQWSRFLISDYSRKVNEILEEAIPVS
jgi:hypothetical protein